MSKFQLDHFDHIYVFGNCNFEFLDTHTPSTLCNDISYINNILYK